MKRNPLFSKLAVLALSVGLAGGALVDAQTTRPTTRPDKESPTTRPMESEKEKTTATVYEIDPVHSTVNFKIMHAGKAWFFGRFNDISGEVHWDEKNPENSKIEVTIPVESIDTKHEGRDEHLRSPDFFNQIKYPLITFESKMIEKTGEDTFELTGDMSMHGVTKTITAEMTYFGSGEGMQGETRAGGTADFTIKRSDFGMTYGIEQGVLGDEVQIMLGIEAVGS